MDTMKQDTYYSRNRKHVLEHCRTYRKLNRHKIHLKDQAIKAEVMHHYTIGIPHCKVCLISDLDMLVLDHIKNDGYKHVTSGGFRLGGSRLYLFLKKNNYPKGLQVLCANCNTKKEAVYKRSLGYKKCREPRYKRSN